MLTALDVDPSHLNEHERNFVANIRKHGWFRTNVMAEDGHLGFSYTTGFWKGFNFPELMIFSLKSDIAHEIFWNFFRDLESGRKFEPCKPISDILSNSDVFLLPVDKRHYREHLGWSLWFYGGDDFPCFELVWPDRNNLFPWQSGCNSGVAGDQQDLTLGGWGGLAQPN